MSEQKEIKHPRTFVTSDTHGMREQLENCLKQAEFDRDIDTLIHLGDCVDRGPDSRGVIDLLLSIPKRICVRGNHDDVFWNWIKTGTHKFYWMHGGRHTIDSYIGEDNPGPFTSLDVPKEHKEFFEQQLTHYVDDKNRCFIHGGFNRHELLKNQHISIFMWDRDLFYSAYSIQDATSPETHQKLERFTDINKFTRIFVGHTPTISYNVDQPMGDLWLPGGTPITKPIYALQLVNIDTGSCFGGKLSLLDITDDDNHILYQA